MEEPAFILVAIIGIFANIVLLTILFKHEKAWSLGKTMLVFLHVTEVVLLFMQLPPYIAVIATAPTVPGSNPTIYLPGYTSECAVTAVVAQFALTIEPFILAMLAYVRWSVVRSSKTLGLSKDPPVRRMIAGLLSFVTLLTIVSETTAPAGSTYNWSVLNLCLGGGSDFGIYVLIISFFSCAPFIGYCYFNVIRTLRDQEGIKRSQQQNKKRTEAIRLLLALTGYYYVSHTAFYSEVINGRFFGKSPAGLLGTRVFIIIYYTYAMMSPILSILLTRRYRLYAGRMFGLLPSGSTLSGSQNTHNTAGSQSTPTSQSSSSPANSAQRSKKYSIAPSSASHPSVYRSSIGSAASYDSSAPHKEGTAGSSPPPTMDRPAGAGFVQPATPRFFPRNA